MDVEAEAPNLDLDSILGDICEAAQGEVADALDGEAGKNPYDGEEDEGGEVDEDEDAEDEGRIQEGHIDVGGGGAATLYLARTAFLSAAMYIVGSVDHSRCDPGGSACNVALSNGGTRHDIHEQDPNCGIFH